MRISFSSVRSDQNAFGPVNEKCSLRSPRPPAPCSCPYNASRMRTIGSAACSRAIAGHAPATPPATANCGTNLSMARWLPIGPQSCSNPTSSWLRRMDITPDARDACCSSASAYAPENWQVSRLESLQQALPCPCANCCATGTITTFAPPTSSEASMLNHHTLCTSILSLPERWAGPTAAAGALRGTTLLWLHATTSGSCTGLAGPQRPYSTIRPFL